MPQDNKGAGAARAVAGSAAAIRKAARRMFRLHFVARPAYPGPDYINNMVSWRREHVLGLLAHVERLSGRDWVSAIARDRQFSEYLLYGYYVERVLGLETAGHWPDARELCKVYWFPEDVTGFDLLKSFEEVLEPWQVAIGVQSFIGQPLDQVRALFEKQASA